MKTINGDFLNFLKKRGFISQCTDEVALKKALTKPVTGYIGFDCTSDSLHIGSLLPLMLLRFFQKHGHKPIILLGGGTTLIGDPSGKDETRKFLSEDQILDNKKSLQNDFEKFISFDKSNKNKAIIVDNYQWLSGLKLINFLRDIGSKFSVNKMLALESIKQRLSREQNLSFLEFNYSILQAFDFLELFENYNCLIQFGGSDQWGNIVSGIDLIRRLKNKNNVFGLTTPLLTTSDGKKMGKTATGAIWLSEKKLSVQNFWQYWRNTLDQDVIKFLYLFTDISTEEIEKYKKFDGSELNKVKVMLANEVTKICHGEEKSKSAEYEAKKILVNKDLDIESINNCTKKITVKNEKDLQISIKDALVELKLCNSNGDAKRLLSQGAVKINNTHIRDKNATIQEKDFNKNYQDNKSYVVLYVGKKNYGIIELIS
jgi:tyrosyl-tRNA synthetase